MIPYKSSWSEAIGSHTEINFFQQSNYLLADNISLSKKINPHSTPKILKFLTTEGKLINMNRFSPTGAIVINHKQLLCPGHTYGIHKISKRFIMLYIMNRK